jgi:DNA-binding MarR family transcriptional regulator
MNHKHAQLVDQILRLTNKLIFLEKKSILKHGDIKLYPSEIHLLDVIDQDKGINASEMAVRLGVTKGAISQTLSRLEKKGVIYKTKDPNHKNELTAHFTRLGNEAFEQHRKSRGTLSKQFNGYLAGVSSEEMEVIKKFLSKLERFFDGLS